MDPRITAYCDRVEFWRLKELKKVKELATLLELAQQAPFPEHVRPATGEDVVPGAVIWFRQIDENEVFWVIVEEAGDLPIAFTCEGERYVLENLAVAFIEVEEVPLIDTTALCRMIYGKEEPVHLPLRDYCWDPDNRIWIESDISLKYRREEQND